MYLKNSFIFLLSLMLLFGCSKNTTEPPKDVQKTSEASTMESNEDKQAPDGSVTDKEDESKSSSKEEIAEVQDTLNKYKAGTIKKGLVSTNLENHIKKLEAFEPEQKDLSPLIHSLKTLKANIDKKDSQELTVLKEVIEVDNQVNKMNSDKEVIGGDKMIKINHAEGILRNSLAPVMGNVSYKIDGKVDNKQIKILELRFSSEVDGVKSETKVDVPVKDGTFTFSKGYEEMFGYFNNLEITAKQADGKTVLDSSEKEVKVNTVIDIAVAE